jgi:hypothetical protein
MALTGNLPADTESSVRFDFPNCYARIVNVLSDKFNWVVNVNFYADQAAREVEALPVKTAGFITLPLGGDPYIKGYDYLKTLPLFAGWVDV